MMGPFSFLWFCTIEYEQKCNYSRSKVNFSPSLDILVIFVLSLSVT